MLGRIEYLEESGGISIFRCYGSGSYVDLPDTLMGKPVIALKDHCFAPEASVVADQRKIKSIEREQWQSGPCIGGQYKSDPCINGQYQSDPCIDGQYQTSLQRIGSSNNIENKAWLPMSAESVKEIVLPDTLKRTEGYAFYGCRNLEKISFPASFQTLGGGNFVAANRIRMVEFRSKDGSVPCLKEVISEIPYEVEVRILWQGRVYCQLLFPGYYEDSKENTPARIIEIKYEGMGYKYRQCFRQGQLDFAVYDSLFPLTVAQELPGTVLGCALDRLKYPISLSDSAREGYLNYLRTCPRALFEKLLKEEDFELLDMLISYGFFDQKFTDQVLDMGAEDGHSQMVSVMMEYKRKHFAMNRQRYSFED